jgi:hypothetical protein
MRTATRLGVGVTVGDGDAGGVADAVITMVASAVGEGVASVASVGRGVGEAGGGNGVDEGGGSVTVWRTTPTSARIVIVASGVDGATAAPVVCRWQADTSPKKQMNATKNNRCRSIAGYCPQRVDACQTKRPTALSILHDLAASEQTAE